MYIYTLNYTEKYQRYDIDHRYV